MKSEAWFESAEEDRIVSGADTNVSLNKAIQECMT
jgi:hypothetical protein